MKSNFSELYMDGVCRHAPAADILLRDCFLPTFLGKLDSDSLQTTILVLSSTLRNSKCP